MAVDYATRTDEAEAVTAGIDSRGSRAIAVGADVSNATEVNRIVSTVAAELGPISILVNNAGKTYIHNPWQQISEEEWDWVMAVNLRICFLTMAREAAVLRLLQSRDDRLHPRPCPGSKY